MAVPDAVSARPDAPVCPAQAEAHPGLRPFLDVAGSPRAERWLDADRGVARPVCRHIPPAANLEVRPALKGVGAGKWAVRGPRRVDAVPNRLALVFRRPNLEAH
jgi:hypothetical protein